MSPRTLTNKLKRLENEGVVRRHSFVRPKHFDYRLTPKGRGLERVVEAMRVYGKKYL